MITDREIWDYENTHLNKIIDEIRQQLEKWNSSVKNFKKEAVDLQKQMWEEVKLTPTDLFDLEGATQVWQYQTGIMNQARNYKFSFDKANRLERMLRSPFFGRIDFIEDGEETAEQIYIGIHNLITSNNREILVYDWRAPISGMFYDYEIGLSSYECPAGTINGQILLKRQYKIEHSQIVYMFDSSLSINDEMLREILGKSTDNRMKTIVTSIQREQNTVIRNTQDRILVVEGPAGSGKTSIALHRAAYLLYKYRDTVKSENILVFSPNHVFEDYISNVLPELGEENILQSTFADYFTKTIDAKYRIESMNEQMECILSGNANKIRLEVIRYKASPEFLDLLIKYVERLENGFNLGFKDLLYNGNLVISSDEIFQLFAKDYSYLPYAKRLEKLSQRLLYLLEQIEEERVRKSPGNDVDEDDSAMVKNRKGAERALNLEYELQKNEILQMTHFDVYSLYLDLFKSFDTLYCTDNGMESEELENYCIYTISQISKEIINYEDLAPILFLKSTLDTVNDTKSIKHVIIDEAQDYTSIHYEIFKKVFTHANITILGDLNQSINGYMNIGNFSNISNAFDPKGVRSITLSKSYRSSKEIADFCKQILISSGGTEQLDRHGNKPKIIRVDKESFHNRLSEDIKVLKNMNYKLIAIICKTAAQCDALYKAISPYADVSLVSNKNEEYHEGVVIIPSYLAKGLEFDAVLVSSVEKEEYFAEEDRRLLYTVCTRALHELYLYYQDNLSEFIVGIKTDCYINEV